MELDCGESTQEYFGDAKEYPDDPDKHLDQEHIGGEEADVDEGAKQGGKQEQDHRERVLYEVCMVPEVQPRDLDDEEEDDRREFHYPDVRGVEETSKD